MTTNQVLQDSFLHCFDPLKASESREYWAETLIPSASGTEVRPFHKQKTVDYGHVILTLSLYSPLFFLLFCGVCFTHVHERERERRREIRGVSRG